MSGPDLYDKNLNRRIARHYSDAFRLFAVHGPEGMLAEGAGWRRVVTRLNHFIANMAILDDGEDLAPLQASIEPLVTPAFPSSAMFVGGEVSPPAKSFLAGNGFGDQGSMPCMAVSIAKLRPTRIPGGAEFVEIGANEAEAWAKAMEQGFGLPEGLGPMCARGVADDSIRLFAAKEDGKILSTSMLFLHDGLAGIYCVATLPEARSRGLGAHVTAEPLRIAAKEGYETGILQSSQAGYPVYKKLGFEEVGSIPIFMRRVESGLGPS
jgi:GNAT superfamily N-acetyltransferase